MNWQRRHDGMIIEQAGAGTLSVLTIDGNTETWDVGAEDGIGWVKQADGSLDIIMRETLTAEFGDFEIVGSFAQAGWQCVRWEAENGTEAESRP